MLQLGDVLIRGCVGRRSAAALALLAAGAGAGALDLQREVRLIRHTEDDPHSGMPDETRLPALWGCRGPPQPLPNLAHGLRVPAGCAFAVSRPRKRLLTPRARVDRRVPARRSAAPRWRRPGYRECVHRFLDYRATQVATGRRRWQTPSTRLKLSTRTLASDASPVSPLAARPPKRPHRTLPVNAIPETPSRQLGR